MRKIFLFITSLFLLTACTSKDQQIISKTQKAHEQLSYVKIDGTESSGSHITELQEYVDFKHDKMESFNNSLGNMSIKDGEKFYVVEPLGFLSFPENKKGTMRESLTRKERLYRQPFEFFKAYDKDFFKHLIVNEEENHYSIHYNPEDKAVREAFYKAYILDFLYAARETNNESDELEKMQFDIDTFDLLFEIDASTNYITKIQTTEKSTLELAGEKVKLERETIYLFSEFDEEHKISIPDGAIEITH